MAEQIIIAKVNLGLFNKSFNGLRRDGIPAAVVRGFSKVAHRGQKAAQEHTKKVFKLLTDYILKGIKYIPEKNAASKFRAKQSGAYKTFRAAIFIRGSNTASKSLQFMVLHETGGFKKPHKNKGPHDKGKAIALPRPYLKTKKYQTSKGATKKMYKPSRLLDYYNKHPNRTPGHKPPGHTKTPAFIISKNDSIRIARRKDKRPYPIFILYEFKKKTHIKKRYEFVNAVTKQVLKHLVNDVQSEITLIDVLKGINATSGFGSLY